jgi:hypothetical protein
MPARDLSRACQLVQLSDPHLLQRLGGRPVEASEQGLPQVVDRVAGIGQALTNPASAR